MHGFRGIGEFRELGGMRSRKWAGVLGANGRRRATVSEWEPQYDLNVEEQMRKVRIRELKCCLQGYTASR